MPEAAAEFSLTQMANSDNCNHSTSNSNPFCPALNCYNSLENLCKPRLCFMFNE